jgi:hypothetical protein
LFVSWSETLRKLQCFHISFCCISFANFKITSEAPDLSHAISEGANKEGSLDKAEGSRSQGGGGGSSWDKAGGGGWDSNKGGDAGSGGGW